ncbi:type IV conjugative transfer system protein TraE [Sphingobium chungbukense]|uniref:Conjugal transfer protein TraE n=1 Tax=Sphingobium chungbukense TaxID=56193 RepID=A0A0M3AKD0_9SPHN|nr:type IV conjugative transfer system protein TraE [Sphingobium chungbukense]KKW90418.1 conjugal transfer protein TraE [Sphingobium chungbukense]
MELSYSHSHSQRVLRQRNILAVVAAALSALSILLLTFTVSRDREVVLQPILRSPITVSSAGVSREYLEMVTRDTVVLTLNRSPQNLEYWMNSVLDIAAPEAQGRIKGDLLKIVNEQRGSSISQFFTIEKMELDTKGLHSEVSGNLHTVVGNKVVSNESRTFRYDWKYSGLSLKLIGFGMVTAEKGKGE